MSCTRSMRSAKKTTSVSTILQLMTNFFQQNKKALGFLREPIAIVGGVGGIRTHARGKPSNDLAKMPKLQFVVLILNLPLYIVLIHCKILLKPF